MSGKVLIVGALGTVGRAMLDHFEQRSDWQLVATSRRQCNFETRAQWISADLCDASLHQHTDALRDVTHVIYAAVQDQPDMVNGWSEREHADVNLRMLKTVVDAVEKASAKLRHITLLQGTKAYGAHLGAFKMPARESDPRYMPPNFYYDQQDFIVERQSGKPWSWSVLRPQLVCGTAIGTDLNVVPVLGVYAAISRESGIPLRYPGGQGFVREATDARLLARAAEWAGAHSACANQVFNIANGDVYLWENLWERLARLYNMPLAPAHAFRLARVMPGNALVWDRIVAKHGLKPTPYTEIVPSWKVADYFLNYGQRPNPHHVSTIKARQFGFQDCIDSEEMFIELLVELQRQKLIPA